MPHQHDSGQSEVRAFLESAAIPFAVADYGPREIIFRQGDPGDSVLYITRGRVLLAMTARSGREAICGLLESGAFLGEDALAWHAVRRESATAMTATEVLVVAKAQMIRLLHTQPAIADRFIAHVLARGTRLEADLTDQLLHSSEERLARVLLVLAGCEHRHPCQCVLPDVPQKIIAEMVGTTRSRVNLFMRKFERLGFIERSREVVTIDATRLHSVYDDSRPSRASSLIPRAAALEKRQHSQANDGARSRKSVAMLDAWTRRSKATARPAEQLAKEHTTTHA